MSNNQNQLALVKKDTVDVVADKVKTFQEQGELHFPANYSPENAMKSAWLKMQEVKDKSGNPVLETCSRDSVANALLNMVVQGLNPSKNQGYFIAYGKTLTFQRSYFGTMAVTKRVTGAKSIDANVIYDGDKVDYEMKNGRVKNLEHKQEFGNINKDNIIGAYCMIDLGDGDVYTELMTMDEIRQAWSQSQMWGKGQQKEKEGSTHDNFKQEMAKKTVINRACKKFINSSDDGSLVINHFNQTDEAVEEAQLEQELEQNANSEIIDIEYNETPQNDQQEDQSENEAIYDAVDQQEEQATGTDGPGF
ncbi:recombinase RecT [Alkalibacillus almallahensis]|uniref:recombinase RecT n=1 Tax=Alkalibacillus almallahensis TaxID=1379154 RepID=UPI0014217631|nr:recombinase RecT [Alkalibacillus almallahensis]NIK12843.1 recombination protein RecT [Alkalibacillus almallahensis]